jgi:hypothetical protein
MLLEKSGSIQYENMKTTEIVCSWHFDSLSEDIVGYKPNLIKNKPLVATRHHFDKKTEVIHPEVFVKWWDKPPLAIVTDDGYNFTPSLSIGERTVTIDLLESRSPDLFAEVKQNHEFPFWGNLSKVLQRF